MAQWMQAMMMSFMLLFSISAAVPSIVRRSFTKANQEEALSEGKSVDESPQSKTAYACLDAYATGLESISRNGLGLASHIRAIDLKAPRVSTRSNILFGAGSGTTGTRSFHTALKMVGLYGWHWNDPAEDKVREAWLKELSYILSHDNGDNKEKCRAALSAFDYVGHHPDSLDYILDTPTSELFIHLFLAYPNAKFLLSTRPGDEWAASRLKSQQYTWAPMLDPCQEYNIYFRRNASDLARMHILKDELVRCVVPKSQLFEVNLWTDGEERKQHLLSDLADFTGHPISNKDAKIPVVGLKILGPGDDAVENLISCPTCHFPENRTYSYEEIGKLIYDNAKFDRELVLPDV